MEKTKTENISQLSFLISSLNPKITEKLRHSIEKTAHILQTPQTREFIQMMLIDPFIKYIFNRIFPYIIIGISLFLALFILIITLFVLILMKNKDVSTVAIAAANNMDNVIKICPFCYSN